MLPYRQFCLKTSIVSFLTNGGNIEENGQTVHLLLKETLNYLKLVNLKREDFLKVVGK